MSLFGLDGRAAVVIGAGSGIGRAVASGCARQGAAVTCVDIDGAAATDTADRIRAEASTATAVGPTIFLASDAASYVTGLVLFADGGWTAADGRFQPPGME